MLEDIADRMLSTRLSVAGLIRARCDGRLRRATGNAVELPALTGSVLTLFPRNVSAMLAIPNVVREPPVAAPPLSPRE